MIPAARIAAAIEVLDLWMTGVRADAALKTWGRSNRFAGSGDRAAIRDHVFDAIRCKRSFAALGGAGTGRGLMLGALRAGGVDPAEVFGTGRFAPPAVAPGETGHAPEGGAALDAPDWLLPLAEASLPDAADFWQALKSRAPVYLRVKRGADVIEMLKEDGVEARPHPEVPTALEITDGARRIARSRAYLGGLVELQDAQSQATVLGLPEARDILDFCAGAGGKTLALADRYGVPVVAHDLSAARMRDLPERAKRAGIDVECGLPGELGTRLFDLVLCDAPCSGSGSWRRDPEGKWKFESSGLQRVLDAQRQVLDAALRHVRPGGHLVYVTCSVLHAENEAQTRAFCESGHDIALLEERRWAVGPAGDGFYRAVLRRFS